MLDVGHQRVGIADRGEDVATRALEDAPRPLPSHTRSTPWRSAALHSPCPTDKRSQYATFTDEGFAVLERIAPSHVAEVRKLVFDRLDRKQVEQLRRIGLTLIEDLE